jgi:phytoene synthase
MPDAFAYCADLVRDFDRDRYIAALFAPAERRGALHALYAFDVEVTRVRDLAHAALPGEIRLQWWSDVIDRARDDEASANPVAAALLATIEQHSLASGTLLDLIEARRFDLYDDPMATVAELEDYARRTSSSIIALVAQILSPGDVGAIADPAGIALGIAAVLRALPLTLARRQLYLPRDLLDRHAVRVNDVFAGRPSPQLAAAVAELRGIARGHLDVVRERLKTLPTAAVPAFLPLAPIRRSLDRTERAAPLSASELPPWRRQWLIWRAARNINRLAG